MKILWSQLLLVALWCQQLLFKYLASFVSQNQGVVNRAKMTPECFYWTWYSACKTSNSIMLLHTNHRLKLYNNCDRYSLHIICPSQPAPVNQGSRGWHHAHHVSTFRANGLGSGSKEGSQGNPSGSKNLENFIRVSEPQSHYDIHHHSTENHLIDRWGSWNRHDNFSWVMLTLSQWFMNQDMTQFFPATLTHVHQSTAGLIADTG